jgi:hypothetical protein
MSQEIKHISINDLVLWTENPRDLIKPDASDQDIVDLALNDKLSKWTLNKLSKEMGSYYDLSELPTVVYHGKKPVVYDGNRRIILGKIKHGLVTIPEGTTLELPDFPEQIPCNVCSKNTALSNVLRKHSKSGSWAPLERDLFLHKFMRQEKSPFLVLEEDTKIISSNPHLNKGFVKDEIFREDILNELGFTIKNGKLNSVHSDEEAKSILVDISTKIKNNKISTRENRGKVVEVLEPISQRLIDDNKSKRSHRSKIKFGSKIESTDLKLTRRTQRKDKSLFGGKLYLKIGEVSNLYRDIEDLYQFYIDNKNELSLTFPSLIIMSLRHLVEAAAKEDKNKRLDNYIKDYFVDAKKALSQDIKTTLSNQNVNDTTTVQLLHTGAHNYQSSNNLEQTIALSIIIGSIITITHGKEQK